MLGGSKECTWLSMWRASPEGRQMRENEESRAPQFSSRAGHQQPNTLVKPQFLVFITAKLRTKPLSRSFGRHSRWKKYDIHLDMSLNIEKVHDKIKISLTKNKRWWINYVHNYHKVHIYTHTNTETDKHKQTVPSNIRINKSWWCSQW